MKKVVDVQIGEVKAERGKVILQSKAIGSCVAIVAYDAARSIGAIAHIMLPGRAPAGKGPAEKTKYAADAIDAMVSQMAHLGSKSDNIKVALVGAGNVLKRQNDTICRDNIKSVRKLLSKRHLNIKAQVLGGTDRRSASLDIEYGIISYTEGNGSETQLWVA